jgi:non-canonical purine NTP pyrophosphatase (RdgB/HAM1 family)
VNQLILATQNAHKIKELKAIMQDLSIELLSLKDLNDANEVIEDGSSFFENAFKKAYYFASKYQIPALSDDSVLCFDALGGAPGIHSARYSGLGDHENNLKLLKEMEGQRDRNAHFISVIVIAYPDGSYKRYEGRVDGQIHHEMRGHEGFGYDVIFYHEPSKMTFGELPSHIKNQISHRANALKLLKEDFHENAHHE